MTRSQRAIAALIAAGAVAAFVGTPAGAQDTGGAAKKKPSEDARSLNPQPEVPSRPPLVKEAKAPGARLPLTPKPLDAGNPKALNPQPEVPSKAKKKPAKKKSQTSVQAPQ